MITGKHIIPALFVLMKAAGTVYAGGDVTRGQELSVAEQDMADLEAYYATFEGN